MPKKNLKNGETDSLARMVQKGFSDLEKKMDKNFVAIDKRFIDIDKRFVEVKGEFIKIDGRFDEVEERLDRIEKMLIVDHQTRIEKLEMEMVEVKESIQG